MFSTGTPAVQLDAATQQKIQQQSQQLLSQLNMGAPAGGNYVSAGHSASTLQLSGELSGVDISQAAPPTIEVNGQTFIQVPQSQIGGGTGQASSQLIDVLGKGEGEKVMKELKTKSRSAKIDVPKGWGKGKIMSEEEMRGQQEPSDDEDDHRKIDAKPLYNQQNKNQNFDLSKFPKGTMVLNGDEDWKSLIMNNNNNNHSFGKPIIDNGNLGNIISSLKSSSSMTTGNAPNVINLSGD
ncbi:hypothetical protein SNEBB_008589 [Seison nebaliae]|nr:hypothetical protein SNEBB_008589 [Seison nebaliae]